MHYGWTEVECFGRIEYNVIVSGTQWRPFATITKKTLPLNYTIYFEGEPILHASHPTYSCWWRTTANSVRFSIQQFWFSSCLFGEWSKNTKKNKKSRRREEKNERFVFTQVWVDSVLLSVPMCMCFAVSWQYYYRTYWGWIYTYRWKAQRALWG